MKRNVAASRRIEKKYKMPLRSSNLGISELLSVNRVANTVPRSFNIVTSSFSTSESDDYSLTNLNNPVDSLEEWIFPEHTENIYSQNKCKCEKLNIKQFEETFEKILDKKIRPLEEKITLLKESIDKLIQNNDKTTNGYVRKPIFLPLRTIAEFQDIAKISDDDFFYLVDYYSYLGGKTTRKQVGLMVNASITSELALHLSLSTQKKVGFNCSKLTDAIYAAVQKNKKSKILTRDALLTIINQAVRSAREKYRYYTNNRYRSKKALQLKK